MNFVKFLPIAIFIAMQATLMMVIEPKAGFLSWAAFQAWAMYFLSGCKPSGALKTFLGYACGIIASIAIMEGAGFFGRMGMSGGINLYLSVFLVVVAVICCEKVPGINFIPAWFVGAGVFFALMNMDTFAAGASMTDKYLQSSGKLMWTCIIGLIFGYVTVTFRGWYESKFVKTEKPATTP